MPKPTTPVELVRPSEAPKWLSASNHDALLQIPEEVSRGRLASVLDELDAVPGVRVAGLIVQISRNAARTEAVQTALALLGLGNPSRWFGGVTAQPFEPEQALYPHQLEALHKILRQGGGILADAMGLGKTRVAGVAAASWRAEERRPIVIIGPRYVRESWAQQLTALGILSGPEELVRVEGLTPKTEMLTPGFVWFIHYQIAHAWLGHMRCNPWGVPCCAIIDEAHWIRNHKARQSAAVHALAGCADHRIALTGTPMPNRVRDLWSLCTLVDGFGQWGSLFDFRRRYAGAIHSGFGYADQGATHVEELQERLEGTYQRRTFADVPSLELPAFRRRAVVVEPESATTKTQHNAWKRIKAGAGVSMAGLLDALRAGALSKDTLAALSALRVASSTAKVATTVKHTASLLMQGASVVVFCWQRRTAERLCREIVAALPDEHELDFANTVHGGVSQAERDRRVACFQAGGGPPGLLVATLDSLREGVTLTVASQLVLHDLSWVPDDLLQAEARIARIGQTEPATGWWMLAKGSADEVIAAHLLDKVSEQALAIDSTTGQQALDSVDLAAALGLESQSGAGLAEDMLTRWEARQ